jgi:hypothetical protein
MISAARLARDFRLDYQRTLSDLSEGLRSGQIKPTEFSLRDLAANLVIAGDSSLGHEGLRLLEGRGDQLRLLESTGAVTTSAFRLVTGRVIDAAVLEGAQLPGNPLSAAMPVVSGRKRRTEMPSPTIPLKEGKSVGDIQEAEEYPVLGIYGERVKNMPARKKGFQIPITREAVLEDDTGALLDAARQSGQMIAREKEHLITDFVAGLISNCVIEQRRGDTGDVVKNLFYLAADTERWANSHVNALVDFTDIDAAAAMLELNVLPGTESNPVLLQRVLLVPERARSNAFRVLNAMETRTGSSPQTVAPNPLNDLGITLISSPHLYQRNLASGANDAQSAGRWYYGDMAQAFRYYELWPIETQEDNTPSQRLTHDIWTRYTVSEMGVPVAVQPRVWSRNLPA